MDPRIQPGIDRLNALIDQINTNEKFSLLTKKNNSTWGPDKEPIMSEETFLDNLELVLPIEDYGFKVNFDGEDVILVRAVPMAEADLEFFNLTEEE